MWGGELLASGRKFDTNIKTEAVKRTSELATSKENGPAVTHDPRALNAYSKPSIPFSSLGPAVLEIGRHLWHKNATPTYIISVIFRICLPKVRMNRGFVNNGVCIIRAFQGICSTCVRSNSGEQGSTLGTRFAIHNFLDRVSLSWGRTPNIRCQHAPFHGTTRS